MRLSPIRLATLLSAIMVTSHAAELPLPQGWQGMEIESKWELTEDRFNTMIAEFPDGATRFGFEVNVRWSGVARRFVDIYYDTEQDELGKALHSIRHRTRSVSDPRAENNELKTLHAATWRKQWERIQYKSTPCRIEAAWLRTESGDCKLWDEDGEDLCESTPIKAVQVLSGSVPHDATDALKNDHPPLSLSKLVPFLEVVDYRYRVELRNAERQPIFEISLDRVLTKEMETGATVTSFEAELEIVGDITKDTVKKLLDLSGEFEEGFDLANHRSQKSKGGVEVSVCTSFASASVRAEHDDSMTSRPSWNGQERATGALVIECWWRGHRSSTC